MPYDFDKLIKLSPGYDPTQAAGDCTFDAQAATLACDFFPACLKHIEGAKAGTPFILEPWQQSIIANLFGWKRADGTRRYRECLIFVSRKNGKTPMCAGIAVYVLFCDDEFGQQNVCAAGELDQATLLFRQAAGMVRQEPELMRRCEIFGERGTSNVRTIMVPESRSYLKVISSDAATKHGGNLHLGIIDELHVQKNRDLVDVLQTSMASANRRQPLLIHVTTADFWRESICNEKYDYACKVRDNGGDPLKPGYDPSFLPVIYETSVDDDWTNPKAWQAANPNLGVSVSLDYLKRECKRAQETPSYENTFRRLHLNQRTQADKVWLPMDTGWEPCGELQYDDEDLIGLPCWGGLDLSSTTDVSALVLVFPEEHEDEHGNSTGRDYRLLCRFWIPGDNAENRERRDRVPYLTWANEGLVTLTPGATVDHDIIRNAINQLSTEYDIQGIAVDRWNATQLINQLSGDGLTMVPWGQGFASMSSPSKELEKLVVAHRLHHAGNPVLRWMASNTMITEDADGNIKPSKKKSTEKIDGIVSLIMAIGASAESEEQASYDYYVTNDLEFV